MANLIFHLIPTKRRLNKHLTLAIQPPLFKIQLDHKKLAATSQHGPKRSTPTDHQGLLDQTTTPRIKTNTIERTPRHSRRINR